MKIVGLTQTQYELLLQNGSVTANGKTVNFSKEDMYLTPDLPAGSAFLCKHRVSMVINNISFTFTLTNYRSKPYTNADQLDPQNTGLLAYTPVLVITSTTKKIEFITSTNYNSSSAVFSVLYTTNGSENIASTTCNSIQINDTVTNLSIVTIDTDKIAGIIESGSNSNGSWTKFVDGTMICTGQYGGSVTYSNTNASGQIARWTYPQAFISIPNVQNRVYSSSNDVVLWPARWGNSITNTQGPLLSIVSSNNLNSTFNVIIDYIAIGKWK